MLTIRAQIDGEIVGLHRENNGRSCASHECCGRILKVGNLVKFYECIVDMDVVPEEGLKAILLKPVDNTWLEEYTVGFLARNIVMNFKNRYIK